MTQKRQSDLQPSPAASSRSDTRIVEREGAWYFCSREGDMGPYESREEAIAEMETYVMLVDLKEENERPVTPDIPEDQPA